MTLNIMLDPSHMYPQMYHPRHPHLDRDWNKDAKFYFRTRRPSRYLWIDFGLSSRYEEGVTAPSELPIWGGDHSVPEFEDFDMPRNPFPTDVYTLGNIIREEFAQVSLPVFRIGCGHSLSPRYRNTQTSRSSTRLLR